MSGNPIIPRSYRYLYMDLFHLIPLILKRAFFFFSFVRICLFFPFFFFSAFINGFYFLDSSSL